jgi:DNA-binding beta-propeller fold protein YncE
VGPRPANLAVTPDGTRVYVSCGGGTVADLDGIAEIATASDSSVFIPMGTNSAPSGIALTPDGTRAYVLSFEGGLSFLDTNPGSATYRQWIGFIPRTLLLAGTLAITPDGKRAVANWIGMIAHAVDVIDVDPASPQYNTVIGSPVPVSNGSYGDVCVSSDSCAAYATDNGNVLCRIDLVTNSVLGGDVLFPGPLALSKDGTVLLTTIGGDVGLLQSTDLTRIAVVDVGPAVGGSMAITPDGSFAYLLQSVGMWDADLLRVPLK